MRGSSQATTSPVSAYDGRAIVSGTPRIGVTIPGSTRPSDFLWHRLYLRPLPHQHDSFAFGKMAGAVAVTDMSARIGASGERGDPGRQTAAMDRAVLVRASFVRRA